MTDTSAEMVVYYQITLAVHVDLGTERVRRVVELRDEIHPREGDPTMVVTDDGLVECDPQVAEAAGQIAETATWPGV